METPNPCRYAKILCRCMAGMEMGANLMKTGNASAADSFQSVTQILYPRGCPVPCALERNPHVINICH
jgi:hypothetical protein